MPSDEWIWHAEFIVQHPEIEYSFDRDDHRVRFKLEFWSTRSELGVDKVI